MNFPILLLDLAHWIRLARGLWGTPCKSLTWLHTWGCFLRFLPSAQPAHCTLGLFFQCSHRPKKSLWISFTVSPQSQAEAMMTEWNLLSHVCDSVDYTVHGILQARILAWVAFPFSRGSSQPRDWTQVSSTEGRFFTSWATREAHDDCRHHVKWKENKFQLL